MTKILVSPGRSTAGRHSYKWVPLVLSILVSSNKMYINFASKSIWYCVLPFQFSLASRPKNFFPVRVLCCLRFMLCISTSKRMLAHAFTWSKMMKKVPFMRGTWEAYKEKRRKQTFLFGFLRFSSFFFVSLSCAWWKRYFFTHFQVFSSVFNHFRPYKRMCKHAFAGQNTQQIQFNLRSKC